MADDNVQNPDPERPSPFKLFTNKIFDPRYIVFTNVTLGFILGAISDLAVQLLQESSCYNTNRTFKMAVAFSLISLFNNYWYTILDKPHYSDRKFLRVFIEIILDLIVGTPGSMTIFFMTCSIFEQTYLTGFMEDITENAPKIYLADLTFNLTFQFVNFYCIPVKFRVIFDNFATAIYNMFLSHLKKCK